MQLTLFFHPKNYPPSPRIFAILTRWEARTVGMSRDCYTIANGNFREFSLVLGVPRYVAIICDWLFEPELLKQISSAHVIITFLLNGEQFLQSISSNFLVDPGTGQPETDLEIRLRKGISLAVWRVNVADA